MPVPPAGTHISPLAKSISWLPGLPRAHTPPRLRCVLLNTSGAAVLSCCSLLRLGPTWLGREADPLLLSDVQCKSGAGPHRSGCVTQSSMEPFTVLFLPGSPKLADNSLGAWQRDNQPAKSCIRKVPCAHGLSGWKQHEAVASLQSAGTGAARPAAAQGSAARGTVALRCQEVSSPWARGTHAACPRRWAAPTAGGTSLAWLRYKGGNAAVRNSE